MCFKVISLSNFHLVSNSFFRIFLVTFHIVSWLESSQLSSFQLFGFNKPVDFVGIKLDFVICQQKKKF